MPAGVGVHSDVGSDDFDSFCLSFFPLFPVWHHFLWEQQTRASFLISKQLPRHRPNAGDCISILTCLCARLCAFISKRAKKQKSVPGGKDAASASLLCRPRSHFLPLLSSSHALHDPDTPINLRIPFPLHSAERPPPLPSFRSQREVRLVMSIAGKTPAVHRIPDARLSGEPKNDHDSRSGGLTQWSGSPRHCWCQADFMHLHGPPTQPEPGHANDTSDRPQRGILI